MADPYEIRISRMEADIDTLSESVVLLTRLDEKLVALIDRQDRQDGTIDKLEGRLDESEKRLASLEKTDFVREFLWRGGWILFAALATAIAYQVIERVA